MDLLRKAYQRAVCVPVDNVELIWQEYNQFENNINKMTVGILFSSAHLCRRFARRAHRYQQNDLLSADGSEIDHKTDACLLVLLCNGLLFFRPRNSLQSYPLLT